MKTALAYFKPHLFGLAFAVPMAWLVKTLASLGGTGCTVLCRPHVALAMGVLGGLLGAQLYRSEHPVKPLS